MGKIFSTPKEVKKRVDHIPIEDMEKIQQILDSYKGDWLVIPKELVNSNSVLRELDKSGWTIETKSSYYNVYPKKWRFRKFYGSDVNTLAFLVPPSLVFFTCLCNVIWNHLLPESIFTGVLFLMCWFCSITVVKVDR